jgi:hypothetical protein
MNSVRTPKGTELPLINLKGKAYLQVAHRLIWFNEVAERYSMDTFVHANSNDDKATVTATISVYDGKGEMIKRASGTKSEHKAHFPDFLEKAETGAIGRALAMLGYGTQFALADLDEEHRIVDSPVAIPAKATEAPATAAEKPAPKKIDKSTWRRVGSTPAAEPAKEAPAKAPASNDLGI